MSTFHPFPRLPTELRQRIWRASIQPREVVVGSCRQRRHRTSAPEILQVDRNSRSYLQRFYIRCCHFPTKPLAQAPVLLYSYVNFDIDTVYCDVNALTRYATDGVHQIQRLILDEPYGDYILDTRGTALFAASALRTVRILDLDASPGDETWWMGWVDLLRSWFHRCVPLVQWDLCIVAPNRADGVEVRPDTWQKLDREWRRAHGPTQEENEFYEGISDEEDDEDAPWRFAEYVHVSDCTCASRLKRYELIGDPDAGKSSWKLLD